MWNIEFNFKTLRVESKIFIIFYQQNNIGTNFS